MTNGRIQNLVEIVSYKVKWPNHSTYFWHFGIWIQSIDQITFRLVWNGSFLRNWLIMKLTFVLLHSWAIKIRYNHENLGKLTENIHINISSRQGRLYLSAPLRCRSCHRFFAHFNFFAYHTSKGDNYGHFLCYLYHRS